MHHEILFPTDQSFHTNLRHAVLFCVSIAGAPQDTRHSIDTCPRSQLGQQKPPTTGRLANTWLSMCAVYAVGCLGCFPASFGLYSQQHELARNRVRVDLGVHCRRAPTLSQVGLGENHIVVCLHVIREGLTSTHAYTFKSSTIHTSIPHTNMRRHVQPHVHVHGTTTYKPVCR